MARRPRQHLPGGFYHVTLRGNHRQQIFNRDADRDALEDALLTAAINRELPFLGICRGAQMLNVIRGGDLIQHLPEVVGDDRYQKGQGKRRALYNYPKRHQV